MSLVLPRNLPARSPPKSSQDALVLTTLHGLRLPASGLPRKSPPGSGKVSLPSCSLWALTVYSYPVFIQSSYAFKVSGPHHMQVIRSMVWKTRLNSSLPRPPITPSANSYLPQRLTRVSPRLSFASFRRSPLFSSRSFHQSGPQADRGCEPEEKTKPSVSDKPRGVRGEKIWTVPNILTASRVLSCPVLGYAILHDNFYVATGLLVYAGLTDFVRV